MLVGCAQGSRQRTERTRRAGLAADLEDAAARAQAFQAGNLARNATVDSWHDRERVAELQAAAVEGLVAYGGCDLHRHLERHAFEHHRLCSHRDAVQRPSILRIAGVADAGEVLVQERSVTRLDHYIGEDRASIDQTPKDKARVARDSRRARR